MNEGNGRFYLMVNSEKRMREMSILKYDDGEWQKKIIEKSEW